MKRLIAGLLMTVVALPACQREASERERLRGILSRMQEDTVQLVYREETRDRTVEVRGRFEDTLRHQETLLINDQKVLERIVRDDVLAVQVSAPDLVPQVRNVTDPQDMATAKALIDGQWVVDPAGAPGLVSAGDQDSEGQIGADPGRDAENVFQYFERALTEANNVILFNPDAIEYQPKEDPFPHPKKAIGERRYDLIRPPLPQREGDFPRTSHFRKMSFYVVKGRLVRVLEQIDISGHEDLVRARRTGRNQFLLRLEAQLRVGTGPEQIREREMSLEILSFGEPLTVDVPAEGYIGNLRALFQREGVSGEGQPELPQLPPGIPPGVVPQQNPPQQP